MDHRSSDASFGLLSCHALPERAGGCCRRVRTRSSGRSATRRSSRSATCTSPAASTRSPRRRRYLAPDVRLAVPAQATTRSTGPSLITSSAGPPSAESRSSRAVRPADNMTTMPAAGALRGFYPTSDPMRSAPTAPSSRRATATRVFLGQNPNIPLHPITRVADLERAEPPGLPAPAPQPQGLREDVCGATARSRPSTPTRRSHRRPAQEPHPSSIWPSHYMPRLMRAGGRGCFDTVALNATRDRQGRRQARLALPEPAEPPRRRATSICA